MALNAGFVSSKIAVAPAEELVTEPVDQTGKSPILDIWPKSLAGEESIS